VSLATLLTAVLRGLGAAPHAVLVVSGEQLLTGTVADATLVPAATAGLEVFTLAATVTDEAILPSP
jgi:hypothetical protein